MTSSALIPALVPLGAGYLLWQGLTFLLCLPCLLSERFSRRGGAALRSQLLRFTLVLIVILPLVATVASRLPGWFRPVAEEGYSASLSPIAPAVSALKSTWNRIAVWRPFVADFKAVQTGSAPAIGETAGSPFQFFCLLAVFVSLILSARGLHRLAEAGWNCLRLHQRPPVRGEAAAARCGAIARQIGMAAPEVRVIEELESPLVSGLGRAIIFCPLEMSHRDEVFWHELTHVRRYDLWWQFLARLVVILTPLQPGSWLLMRALKRADEDVCDDVVLACGADRFEYVRFLVGVAETQRPSQADLCVQIVGFRSQLGYRVERLMEAPGVVRERPSLLAYFGRSAPIALAASLALGIYLDRAPVEPRPLAAFGTAETAPAVIRRVRVEASSPSLLTTEQIVAQSGLKTGATVGPADTARAVKAIYATGQFRNVELTGRPWAEGVEITLTVEPRSAPGQAALPDLSGSALERLPAQLLLVASASPRVLRQPLHEGIAAVVDGDPITTSEVTAQLQGPEDLLRTEFSGERLERQQSRARSIALAAMIEDKLILHAARREDAVVPREYIDLQLERLIKNQYQNNRELFLKSIAYRGMSEAEFRLSIEETTTIASWKNRYILRESKAENRLDQAREAQELLRSWLEELRQKAHIEIR